MLTDGIELTEGTDIANCSIRVDASFPSNANVSELFYKTSDALYLNDGSNWMAFMRFDESRNFTMGYTTNVETLGSNTITPDITSESIKSRAVDGNVTINFPTGGTGIIYMVLTADGSGPYTVTLGANIARVGEIPDLLASTSYLVTLLREDATSAIIKFQKIG